MAQPGEKERFLLRYNWRPLTDGLWTNEAVVGGGPYTYIAAHALDMAYAVAKSQWRAQFVEQLVSRLLFSEATNIDGCVNRALAATAILEEQLDRCDAVDYAKADSDEIAVKKMEKKTP